MFEQIFKKPKMTEKLLSRPPFRYIHDIFSATIEATGFGQGIFNEEEMNSKSITEKDQKVFVI
jgi:TRAF3-interacting protein 1